MSNYVMLLKYKLAFLLLAFSIIVFAQKDTNKTQAAPVVKQDGKKIKHFSNKGRIFIAGGIGASTILERIYFSLGGNDAYGKSQSIVENGTIDYCLLDNKTFKNFTIGLGAAYQTASGIPGNGSYTSYSATEDFTRLNISVRLLLDILCTPNAEIYYGLRGGVSYWTDVITPSTATAIPTLLPNLMTTNSNGHYTLLCPSMQYLIGIRILGPVGFHLEAAIGTPYFIEGGLMVMIGTRKKASMPEDGQKQ
ncbi:MAG: hypothetical protein ACLQQ4_07165 [Bacteroidia bacterium]